MVEIIRVGLHGKHLRRIPLEMTPMMLTLGKIQIVIVDATEETLRGEMQVYSLYLSLDGEPIVDWTGCSVSWWAKNKTGHVWLTPNGTTIIRPPKGSKSLSISFWAAEEDEPAPSGRMPGRATQ